MKKINSTFSQSIQRSFVLFTTSLFPNIFGDIPGALFNYLWLRIMKSQFIFHLGLSKQRLLETGLPVFTYYYRGKPSRYVL